MPGGNSASTIFALAAAGILTLVVPTITLMNRYDNVVQENVDLVVSQLVSDVTSTGRLSMSKVQDFENDLTATGNVYDTEMELYILDENPGKKTSQTNYVKIGENVYLVYYTTQVYGMLRNGTIALKEGDFIKVKVKNQNSTAAQNAESGFFNSSSEGEYVINVEKEGMVRVNGAQ